MQARDTWRSVRTNHLFVIGNADPENLRQVALWLEFFHGAFARLVSRRALDSSVPTTVIVFRDEVSFLPFKPLYQGRPTNVSGYFQPGDDMNYIAISLNSGDRDPFATAFHEYVHLHLKKFHRHPVVAKRRSCRVHGSLQFSAVNIAGSAHRPFIRLLRNRD